MSGFSHQALLYSGEAEFLAATVPFLEAGLEAGEVALVVLPERRLRPLQDALGEHDSVLYRNMSEVGRNPARIISAWHEFVDRHGARGGIRGIGEPALAERSSAALAECDLHERLLNLAFSPGPEWILLCPYDVDALGADVVEAARRNHPHLLEGGKLLSSDAFALAPEPLDAPLTEPPGTVAELAFDGSTLGAVRRAVAHAARRAGLNEDSAGRLLLAANEIATNAVRHGGGRGRLRLWEEHSRLVCEVRSRNRLHDPLAGRRRPAVDADRGRGLWLVNHLCELVELRSSEAGTVVRLHVE